MLMTIGNSERNSLKSRAAVIGVAVVTTVADPSITAVHFVTDQLHYGSELAAYFLLHYSTVNKSLFPIK